MLRQKLAPPSHLRFPGLVHGWKLIIDSLGILLLLAARKVPSMHMR